MTFCADCGKTDDVTKRIGLTMIAMQPGKDGVWWHLCSRCFREGTKPGGVRKDAGRG